MTALLGAIGVSVAMPASAAVIGGFDFDRAQVSVTGLQVPWGMAFLPDGSALVSERNTGRIMQVRPGQTPTAVATISGVSASGESGLLGIAVSPNYATDQWVYAYFTTSTDNRLVRLRLNAPTTQNVLFSGVPRNTIHDGGRIAFGPDGMLYVATGDAGTTANAQNLNSPGGKILRMTPDGGIPASGQPFANSRVWSYGHRNVQGLAWDNQGRMYASEFGQNNLDEVNQIVAGGNYGWPTCEGSCTNPSFRNPIISWTTAEASPSGLAYANNTLFVAALRGTRLWTVTLNASGGAASALAQFQGAYGRLRAVSVGPDGWLWVATSNRDGRGTPIAADDRIIRVPPAGVSPSPSPSVSPPVDTVPPTTPGAPTAFNVTSSAATLNWPVSTDSGGSGLAGYNVYREQGATDPLLAQPASNSATLTGLTANTQYQVYVRARDNAGNLSGNSTLVTFTTTGGTTTGGCSATGTVQTQWGNGYVIQPLTVTNTGTTGINGWTVAFTLPAGHTITGSWNTTITVSGQNVTARNVGHNGTIAAGGNVQFGFQVSRPNGNTATPSGYTCTSP
ncbi:PQQ-dependent sugar dehydrogenase [Acrocarpospora corrugata]|uniref:PQQ-dependent sugar dehydrogenase n=1 Tax=Acrocarpospora corrugata TaxID=35763 RepID=UPI001FE7CEED|nr:PQQ-dependent sugar dehydrogenase [Acrocarpospora corrugata]